MPLVLPNDHRARAALHERGVACLSEADARRADLTVVRIGIINLMPAAELYEPMLLAPLAASELLVVPAWIRLHSHSYQSTDLAHLERWYVPFERALAPGLSGLVLTGAPVEELAYEDVRYWGELAELLRVARHEVNSTLGLCWGGMALGKLLGIEKASFAHKLLGVYPLARCTQGRVLFDDTSESFDCAQSRHAGIDDAVLEAAERAGTVHLLAHSASSGYTIFESTDRRYLAHLGHPEYTPARLAFEYQRDRQLGRSDVPPPWGVDLAQAEPHALPHGRRFLTGWLRELVQARRAAPA
jgi:homoserine O-succinyltransferase